MDKLTIVVSIIGIFGTISSIYFAYIAYKKKDRNEIKNEGLKEGTTLTDIMYIKASIDRVLENLNKVEKRYDELQKRLMDVIEKVHKLTIVVDKIKE